MTRSVTGYTGHSPARIVQGVAVDAADLSADAERTPEPLPSIQLRKEADLVASVIFAHCFDGAFENDRMMGSE